MLIEPFKLAREEQELGLEVGVAALEVPRHQLPLEKILDALRMILLDRRDRTLVCHDAVFQFGVLRQAGLDYRGPIFDTLLAAWLAHPGRSRREYDLDRIGKLGPFTFSQVFKVTDLAIDAVGVLRLILDLYQNLKEPMETEYASIFELEMRFIPVLISLEAGGYPFDRQKVQTLRDRVGGAVDRLKAEIEKETRKEINWKDDAQVRNLVYDTPGMPVLERSEKGYPSTSHDALINLAVENPLLIKIARLRVLENRLLAYLEPLAEQEGHSVRNRYSLVSQVTGRVSCLGSPNLGLVPAANRDRPELHPLPDVRRVFIAPEDQLIVKLDYEAQEVVILAALAGEQDLLDAYI